jgi:hypothetical protein
LAVSSANDGPKLGWLQTGEPSAWSWVPVDFDLIDHVPDTFKPANSFLGELLEVEAGQPAVQKKHAAIGLA